MCARRTAWPGGSGTLGSEPLIQAPPDYRLPYRASQQGSSLWVALVPSHEYIASHDFRHALHVFQDVVPHPVCRGLV
jgi:hypothetical protein